MLGAHRAMAATPSSPPSTAVPAASFRGRLSAQAAILAAVDQKFLGSYIIPIDLMGYIILFAILGIIGYLAKKWIFQIWENFQLVRLISEQVYGEIPISGMQFFQLIIFWWLLLASIFLFPPIFFTILLFGIARQTRVFIKKSSLEVGCRLLFYSFLMAMVILFTIVGIIAFIAALNARRESVFRNQLDQIKHLNNLAIANR